MKSYTKPTSLRTSTQGNAPPQNFSSNGYRTEVAGTANHRPPAFMTSYTSQRQQRRDEPSPLSDDLEEEMRDEVKNELQMDFERVFGKEAAEDDDFDIDASDTEVEKRMMEEYTREFQVMDSNQKLQSLARKTHDLFKKAQQFDDQMINLNKQYNFLDKNLEYESKRITQDMIPTQNYNYGVGTPSSK